jgi:hypothetical protein
MNLEELWWEGVDWINLAQGGGGSGIKHGNGSFICASEQIDYFILVGL